MWCRRVIGSDPLVELRVVRSFSHRLVDLVERRRGENALVVSSCSNGLHVVGSGHFGDVVSEVCCCTVDSRVERRGVVGVEISVGGVESALHVDGEELKDDFLDLELSVESLVGAGARELGNHRCHMLMHVKGTRDQIDGVLSSTAVVLFNTVDGGNDSVSGPIRPTSL